MSRVSWGVSLRRPAVRESSVKRWEVMTWPCDPADFPVDHPIFGSGFPLRPNQDRTILLVGRVHIVPSAFALYNMASESMVGMTASLRDLTS